MRAQRAIQLSTGTLQLEVSHEMTPLGDLLDFAARRNPRRGFLFVAKDIGRYLPARPGALLGHCHALAEQLSTSLPGPVLFVGVAEAGIALAHGVADAYRVWSGRDDTLFWHSSRLKLDIAPLCSFSEPHSHAPSHHLYARSGDAFHRSLSTVQSLVLIDDEITTGETMRGLHAALKPHLSSLKTLSLVALSDWSNGAVKLTGESAKVLVSGSYTFTSRDLAASSFPSDLKGGQSTVSHTHLVNEGRLGRLTTMEAPSPDALGLGLSAERSVLILGTGEHQWRAIKLAQALNQRGVDAWFQMTTRAPVRLEGPIKSKLEFTDSYGEGLSEALYNFEPERWDEVYILHEAPTSFVSAGLLEQTGGTLLSRAPHG